MNYREILNWFSTLLFALGTIALLSPHVASVAITPWIAFLTGNVIMLVDFVRRKNTPWICLTTFFIIWDVLLITSRICGMGVFGFLMPFVSTLNYLP